MCIRTCESLLADERRTPMKPIIWRGALLKLDRGEQARQELEKLLQREDVWALVAQSAAALMDGEKEKAREIAGRAVEAEPDQFFVRYQQGLAAAEGGEWQTAAAAFVRAAP